MTWTTDDLDEGDRLVKVTSVDVLHADIYLYVKVSTDEGLVGWGEMHPGSGTGGTPYLPIAGVQYCAEYLVGKNPLEIEKHWQHMFRRCLFRGGADVMAAIGAIDIALWDIKGKAVGRPVYELLGGPTRDRVRLYTHLCVRLARGARCGGEGPGRGRLHRRAALSVSVRRRLRRRRARGSQAARAALLCRPATCSRRVGCRGSRGRGAGDRRHRRPRQPTHACRGDRRSAGRSSRSTSTSSRIRSSRRTWTSGHTWRRTSRCHSRWASACTTLFQFRDLLRAKGAAFVRPDLSLAGGITNIKKIAALAEAEYVGVVPHNPLSAVLTAACVQLDAATHNIPVQEYPYSDNQGVKRDLVNEPLVREGGFLLLPTAPGIGIEVNEEAVEHYPPRPYERPALLNADGSLRDY